MQETAQQYTQRILGHVEGQDALKVQRSTADRLKKAVRGLSPKQMKWREPGKWSIAEIVAHLADSEIVTGWRLRSVIGENGVTVQPYDQNAWTAVFNYIDRDVKLSLETFRILRENNLAMLKRIPRPIWDNYGMHLERGKESVAHLTRMIAGHDTNHALQVERIAKQLKSAKTKPKTKKKRR